MMAVGDIIWFKIKPLTLTKNPINDEIKSMNVGVVDNDEVVAFPSERAAYSRI